MGMFSPYGAPLSEALWLLLLGVPIAAFFLESYRLSRREPLDVCIGLSSEHRQYRRAFGQLPFLRRPAASQVEGAHHYWTGERHEIPQGWYARCRVQKMPLTLRQRGYPLLPVRPPARSCALFRVLRIWGCEPIAQTCRTPLLAPLVSQSSPLPQCS